MRTTAPATVHAWTRRGDRVTTRCELWVPALGRSLPLTLAVYPDAAELLGMSRFSAYAAVRAGDVPCLRIGRRILVPTATLLKQLGLTIDVAEQPVDNAQPAT